MLIYFNSPIKINLIKLFELFSFLLKYLIIIDNLIFYTTNYRLLKFINKFITYVQNKYLKIGIPDNYKRFVKL